jgi:hypothetical protein
MKPNSWSERKYGRWQGMIIMGGIVMSWCVIYEVMFRLGLAVSCR